MKRLITAADFRRAADDALLTWGVLAVLTTLGALFFLSLLIGGWLWAAKNGVTTP